MIRSMTGYGSGEADDTGVRTGVEIRSVNGRFCDISVKLPRALASLEARVREKIQAHITRGNISVSVRWEGDSNGNTDLVVDMEAGQRFYDAMRQLQERLGVPGDITIDMIAVYPSLLKPAADEVDLDRAWTALDQAMTNALDDLAAMKTREGKQLADDLTARIHALDGVIDAIEARAPERVEALRQRLRERIAALLGEEAADPQRLAMEVALFAERSDVTEECVRFRSHNQEFLAALQSDEAVGRRLNFLLQEMNREANTIGSKANDIQISHQVIKIKEELEKIREQVQNIE